MKKAIATAATVAVAGMSGLAHADAAQNKQVVKSALDAVFVNLDESQIDTYFADPYIQHNPAAASGVDALKGLVGALKNNGLSVENIRLIAEDDLVVAHNIWQGFGPLPMVALDIFRVENGKIVEHWDNMIPLADAPNPSGRTQTDGDTAITDLDKAADNKAKVVEFISAALIRGEQVDYTQYINPAKYLQHNPQVADGLDGFGAFMGQLAEQGISMSYSDIHIAVAEGNFVLTASEGQFGGAPTAFFDLFRLEDGLIVEHWDIIADMPSGDLPAGYPGKF